MKNTQYINRDYVSPVNLTTLGKTFDVLEQGHKEAVKTASDLELSLAKLPIHASEAEWRQRKINEIRKVVEDNTIYGNSYAALDDLIAKQNIFAGGDVIGRIKSNKAYEDYNAQLQRANIPEGMKDMYREKNPYHYEDGGIDEKTGMVLEGKTWTPNTKPVNSIDFFQLMRTALSTASRESGSGDFIQFLDANGKPTTDPSKSVDGAMYKQTSTSWERLPAEKIKRAVYSAIENTPGAKDSLMQDYNYARWKVDKESAKLKKDGKSGLVPNTDVTDENGVMLNFDKFIDKKVDPFAEFTKINNVNSHTSYGSALQNARKPKIDNRGKNGGYGDIQYPTLKEKPLGANTLGMMPVHNSDYNQLMQTKSKSNNNALSIIRKYGYNLKNIDSISDLIKNTSKGRPYQAAVNIIKSIESKGKKISDADKNTLFNSISGYVSANSQLNTIYKSTNKANQDALSFSRDVNSQNYTSDNKYSSNINNTFNDIFPEGKGSIVYTVGKDVYSKLSPNYIKELQKEGINITIEDDGDAIIKIDSDHKQFLPKLNSEVIEADGEVTGNPWFAFKRKLGFNSKSNYVVKGIDGAVIKAGNYNDIGYNKDLLKQLNNYYNKGINAGAQAEEEIGSFNGMLSVQGTGATSKTQYGINSGELYYSDDKQAKEDIKQADEMLDNMFASNDFDSSLIYRVDDGGRFVKDIENARDYRLLINKAYTGNSKIKVNRQYVDNSPSDNISNVIDGYYLTLDIGEGKDIPKDYQNTTMRLFIHGSIDDNYAYQPQLDTKRIANNMIRVSRETNTISQPIEYNDYFGSSIVTPKPNGKFSINFMDKNVLVNEVNAGTFNYAMLQLERLKAAYHVNSINQEALISNIVDISDALENITGKDHNTIQSNIISYINSGYER